MVIDSKIWNATKYYEFSLKEVTTCKWSDGTKRYLLRSSTMILMVQND